MGLSRITRFGGSCIQSKGGDITANLSFKFINIKKYKEGDGIEFTK